MPELIDRDALLEILCSGCTKYSGGMCRNEYGRCAEYTIIKQMPTIEAEPVRHGRWIFVGEETTHDGWTYRKHKCTECDFVTVEAKNFCQNCGARMDGGAENG